MRLQVGLYASIDRFIYVYRQVYMSVRQVYECTQVGSYACIGSFIYMYRQVYLRVQVGMLRDLVRFHTSRFMYVHRHVYKCQYRCNYKCIHVCIRVYRWVTSYLSPPIGTRRPPESLSFLSGSKLSKIYRPLLLFIYFNRVSQMDKNCLKL